MLILCLNIGSDLILALASLFIFVLVQILILISVLVSRLRLIFATSSYWTIYTDTKASTSKLCKGNKNHKT